MENQQKPKKHDIIVLMPQEDEQMKLRDASEVTLKEQQEMMEKYKFVVHYVMDSYEIEFEDQTLSYPSIHTHGLMEHFEYPEIEIALPLDQETAMYIMHTFVNKLKEGVRVEEYEEFKWPELNHTRCYCAPVHLPSNTALQGYRLVIGDMNDLLPGEAGCHKLYNLQLDAGHLVEGDLAVC